MNASLRLKSVSAAIVAAVALAACGGGSSAPISPVPANVPAPSTSNVTNAVAYGAAALKGATFLKRATLGSVGVDVLVKMRDPAGLVAYAKAANDPKSGVFRHWLTPQELGDRFGAPASDYAATAQYLTANGIAVKAFPQRQILRIHGPQANVERALGMQFGVYRSGTRTFVAPVGAPRPSVSLHVSAVLDAVRVQKKSRRLNIVRASTAFVQGYSPQQLAGGFDFDGAYAQGYKGAGISIGIIGTGPIADGDKRIALGDTADYRKLYKISGTGTVKQDIDLTNYSQGDGPSDPNGIQYSQTGLATPPPVTSPFNTACTNDHITVGDPSTYGNISDYSTCNPEDFESQLDTEQASGLAPDATVNFYIAYNQSECYGTTTCAQEIGLAESDDEIQQAIADNKSDVISMSFGEDESSSESQGYFGVNGDPGFEPMEFASLVSEGIAVFASSGDNGAEECADQDPSSSQYDTPCTSYPATDPSVISVGGVNAPLDDSGRLTGPMTGWGLQTQAVSSVPGGSGGGCSAYFDVPAYESGVTLPCSGKRPQPDLSLDADTNTGVATDVDADSTLGGRFLVSVGGTSVATPEMAAMWGLVLQACKASASCTSHGSGSTPYRLGNPGAYIYKVYKSTAVYPTTFYDVLFGNNSLPNSGGTGQDPGFNAGKGYDLVTGIGVPFGKNFISAVLANVP